MDKSMSDKTREARARRRAKRLGYGVKKSRWRLGSIDNHGGYMLFDAYRNWVVDGDRYDLSIDDLESRLDDLEHAEKSAA